jgi:hypothetical protein
MEARHRTAGLHLTAAHHPDDTGEEKTAAPSGPWNPTPPQRHATTRPRTARDMTGSQPHTATPSHR